MKMTCPFCGSDDLDIPMVDIGVGYQQVAAATCACGALQMNPYDDESNERADDEEKRVGWWRPR
jgi:transcription elongation factor Elf1